MLETKRYKGLRIRVMLMLALLAIQYEFGMAVNISDPPHLTPFGFSMTAFNDALNRAGLPAQLHAGLGILLGIGAIAILISSLRTGIRSVQVFGSLGFLTVLVAGIMGQLFVQSGFQNDNWTHGMASNFILSFIFYFLVLYFLKPVARSQTSNLS
jgi:hypothetical protein